MNQKAPARKFQRESTKVALAIFLVAAAGLASQTEVSMAGGGGGRSGITEECNEKTCEVRMTGRTFTPDTLKVKPGSTVIWSNLDSVPHTVTSGFENDSQDPLFNSGIESPLIEGGKWQHTFSTEESGVYRYYCVLHPGMSGQIIVSGEPIEEFPRLAVMILAGAGIFGAFGIGAAIYLKKKRMTAVILFCSAGQR
jgi:plastocyanin